MTLGGSVPTIRLDRPPSNHEPVIRTLYKRGTSSKAVYIGILSGVLGTIVILTLGVCWKIQRRRIASKRRELEEAQHPRDPMSYTRFPVRPGDEEEGAEEIEEGIGRYERGEEREGLARDTSEPVTAPIRSYPAMMSVVPNHQALTLPLRTPQLPQLPHALHGTLRSTVSSHHPSDLAPLHSGTQREREGDIPQYEEAAALPPPFFDSSVIPRPPGLGEDGAISTRPSMSSRPVTASAPPAYTPSDTGHMTTSSHSHSGHHELEPEAQLQSEDEHEHRHVHGHGQHHSGRLTEAPADTLNSHGRSISPS